MKVRLGFVSNSSSSSFIIRGVKVKTSDVAKLCGVSEQSYRECEGMDAEEEIAEKHYDNYVYEMSDEKLSALKLNSRLARNYFDGDEFGEIVIGDSSVLGCLEDGEVVEITEPNEQMDNAIKEKLIKFGFENVDKLKTYIQYVSNDNY